MTPKAIITLLVGILALGVTAWKGPSAWSAVSTAVTAIALFVGTLSIIPPKDAEYIADLETAIQNTPKVDALPLKSRMRLLSKPKAND